MIPIITVVLLLPAIISFLVLLFTYKPQARYKNGMLFAVTLPPHAMEHPDIGRVQAQFNKQLTKTSIAMALFLAPMLLLYTLTAYQVIYFLVWFSVFFFIMVIPFRRAFRDTLALKRRNEWFVGTKRVITSDLRVAHLKNQRAASPWLFVIPLLMSAGLILWASQYENGLVGAASGGLAITVMLWLIALGMRRKKAKVYSENSEVNVSLNQAGRKISSYLWLFLAIVENIHFFIVCLLLANDNETMSGVWITISLLFSAIPIGMVLYAYRKINALEQEVLSQEGKTIYTDDDEYWANGFSYHNPHDKSIFVTKRIGIGETVNTATPVGKAIIWGTAGITAAVIGGAIFMLLRSELTSPELTITPDHRVEIDYPMYSFDFGIGEIEELVLVDQVPSGMKTNGEATGQNARGHFRLKELGKSRLYIFKNNPPYIRIKLPKVYVFYNDKDPNETKLLYDRLQSEWER